MFFSLNAVTSMDPMDRLALVCIPVILILIAMLIPKKKKAQIVIRVLMILLLVAVAVLPMIPAFSDAVGLTGASYAAPDLNRFVPVLILAEAFVLLWGLFFDRAFLTQGLYGMIFGICITVGIAGFAYPEWLGAASFPDALTSPAYLFGLLQYGALVFVPVWLLDTRIWQVKLGSAWQSLYGMTVLGSLSLYLQASGLVTSPLGEKLMGAMKNGAAFTPDADALRYCGIFAGIVFGGTFLVSFLAPLSRRVFYRSEEKWIVSETKGALWIRVIGRTLAGVGGVALVVLMPSIISLTALTGTAANLLYFAPIAWILIVQLLTEFLSEDSEIKQAQADFAATHSAA